MICLAGALQLRPIPTAELNHLVTEVADPASVQRCTTASQVRYCLYPGFGRDLLPSLEAPVNGVLAHLPARPAQPLTVRQVRVAGPARFDPHPWPSRSGRCPGGTRRCRQAPGNAAPASAIYLPVGAWPAAGGQLADAHFDVALAAADWAVRLPATGSSAAARAFLPCVPLDQAREAIAIWLAILATRPPAGELQAGLGGRPRTFKAVDVATPSSPIWNYPGAGPAPSRPRRRARRPPPPGTCWPAR